MRGCERNTPSQRTSNRGHSKASAVCNLQYTEVRYVVFMLAFAPFPSPIPAPIPPFCRPPPTPFSLPPLPPERHNSANIYIFGRLSCRDKIITQCHLDYILRIYVQPRC